MPSLIQFAPNASSSMGGGLLALVIFACVLWIISIVQVARTRTKDPFDRIVWLLVILSLHVLGSLLYWFFAESDSPAPLTEEEIKERANKGTLR